jgi:murein DD-endopeptidase MepM/ murein hydrolase activator NlpD
MAEIHLHRSDIRKAVIRVRLDERRTRFAFVVGVAFVALELFGLAVSPFVAGWERERELLGRTREELETNRRTLERSIAALDALRERAEQGRNLVAKLSGMYGIPVAARGLGGIPLAPAAPGEPGSPEQADRIIRKTEHGLAVANKLLEDIVAYENENGARVRLTPSLSPLPSDGFVPTSSFGPRQSPFTRAGEFHNGIDLSIAEGTPVIAPADATVLFAGRFPLRTSVNWWRYGNCVVLDHGGYFQTIYAHLASTSVRTGQKVKQGTQIGLVGSTGWSTSPHLHYEIRVRNPDARNGFVPVDPRIYMLDRTWNGENEFLSAKRPAPKADEFDPLPIR